MKNNQNLGKNLLDLTKQKEQADEKLLIMEVITGIISIHPLITTIIFTSIIPIKEVVATILIITSIIPFLIALPFMLWVEQTAGYYECNKCGHRYVPTYKSVFLAPHICRTRYMKCPECNKKSWQKKVLSKFKK